MAKTELSTASVLAFERKLDTSDGLFSAGHWDDTVNGANWPSITIHEKSVRGTISNRLKTKEQDPAKLNASIQYHCLARFFHPGGLFLNFALRKPFWSGVNACGYTTAPEGLAPFAKK